MLGSGLHVFQFFSSFGCSSAGCRHVSAATLNAILANAEAPPALDKLHMGRAPV